MHRFKYKGNSLYCENVKISDIAKRIGTPLYVYSKNTFLDHYRKIESSLSELSPLICFSVKSNSNLAVLETLVKAGSGLDIVSGGELFRAKSVKARPEKIVYAGVGKKESEIIDAIRYGILFFNVESQEELELINRCAKELGRTVNIAIRINPDVTPATHRYITTGKGDTKFGVDFNTAKGIFRLGWKFRNARINGVHIHIGSQILSPDPFKKAVKKVLKFLDDNRIFIEYLNIGGGLGIVYTLEKPQTANSFAKRIIPLLRKSKLKLILEPGRFISGNSGIMVTKVLFRKKTGHKNFAIVDGGMNDLIRPSLYEAKHTILPVTKPRKGAKKTKYDIVGPVCETGDFLAKDRVLPSLKQGDLIAAMSAGAYGFTMSSNYNSRPRAAEVMVNGDKFSVIRKRESYKDLIKGETKKA